MADCIKCNKKLGSISKKYKIGKDFYCPSCYSDYLMEAKKKMGAKQARDMEIIRKYVQKYIPRLTPQEVVFIEDITLWPYKLITEEYPYDTVLEICKTYNITKKPWASLRSALIDDKGNFRSLNALSAVISFELQQLEIFEDDFELYVESYELGTLDGAPIPPDKFEHVIEKLNTQLTFVNDLEKLIKLCVRDGVNKEVAFSNIFKSIMSEINLQIDDAIETSTNEIYHKIDLLVGDNRSNPDKIIKKYLEIEPPDMVSEDTLKLLLDKFGLSLDNIMLSGKIKDIREELELDKFEKKLERPRHLFVKNFDELTPFEFEDFLADLFKHLKYDVIKTPRTGDQGADLILNKNDKRIVVQAKKYSGAVNNSAVQQVVASKPHYKADRAMVVTTSAFTPSAIELAKSNQVILWGRKKLTSVVNKVENEFLAQQESFSDDIIKWVVREQLIEDWIENYEKLTEIGGFDELKDNTIAYVDELAQFVFDYINKKTPFLESITSIKTGESWRDETYQTLEQLSNMLDELRTRFIFLYHYKVNNLIKSTNMPREESKKYEEAIIPKIFNIIISLSIFLINLINLIRWLNYKDVITVDEEEIYERVRQIKLLIERDCPNELNEIARTYETLNKSIETNNIKR